VGNGAGAVRGGAVGSDVGGGVDGAAAGAGVDGAAAGAVGGAAGGGSAATARICIAASDANAKSDARSIILTRPYYR
jgi:hypothetical protein